MAAASIGPATLEHAPDWARMRHALWPDESLAGLQAEAEAFFGGAVRHLRAVLLAFDPGRSPIGFAELNLRPYAEGCDSEGIAFLEGWFVEPAHRRRGVGRELIRAAEDWARLQGCSEFASDALADNALGHAAHLRAGFEEVEVIRCFRKALSAA
jgi:aminoglycoside 6'-N-acetyltransferase I